MERKVKKPKTKVTKLKPKPHKVVTQISNENKTPKLRDETGLALGDLEKNPSPHVYLGYYIPFNGLDEKVRYYPQSGNLVSWHNFMLYQVSYAISDGAYVGSVISERNSFDFNVDKEGYLKEMQKPYFIYFSSKLMEIRLLAIDQEYSNENILMFSTVYIFKNLTDFYLSTPWIILLQRSLEYYYMHRKEFNPKYYNGVPIQVEYISRVIGSRVSYCSTSNKKGVGINLKLEGEEIPTWYPKTLCFHLI